MRLQCAVLVVFNMVTMLLVFPAVISLDLIRRRRSRADLLCCFTWSVLVLYLTQKTLTSEVDMFDIRVAQFLTTHKVA